ncbi:putative disease resistance protein RGA4 [Cryptomeria japonica]|uniref:putative disease resistance protein RGA4 n=1 Tax=Cryptomeria japonica TaxID=3369 RepID=UPI0027DA4CFA|nr:putative disease resistance protein RGA4 [Cryptomeria japonica]
MAFLGEAVVGKICEMAVEMAVQKLTDEAKLLLDFSNDFSWLNDNLTNQWLEKVRVFSLLAEDICEECAIESMYRNDSQACSPSYSQWIFRYRIGRKIKDIKERMRYIIEDVNKLKLLREVFPASEVSPSTSHSVDRKKSYLLPSVHSVGIDSKVDDMLRLLDNNASPIIAVVGMGGIASHLGLGQQIRSEGISHERAAELIHENLKGKRYLTVLDDVWEASEDLLCKLGLLAGDNGHCKILVSTRNRKVCTILNAHIYEIQCLSEIESWSLFCFYAFKGNEAPNHQLEEVGRDILKQCGNLPLGIKMVEQINCEYLVYLWIGEGFIPAGEGQWDAAWDCINQLTNLCLLQHWEQYEDGPGCKLINYCRTHDLLHDLAITISKENRCIFSVEEASKGKSGDCSRILLGMKDVNDPPISERHLLWLRTLSLSQN